jgi:carbon monoxide dehydrogenase subunit G
LKTSRSRPVEAPRPAVWDVVSNPYHLARWWPKVARVEAVQERTRGTGTLWTKVLQTQAGRHVRADFRCLYSKAPSAYGWEQEIEGSPFAKVLRSSEVRIELEEADGGTLVVLRAEQRLRGLSRFGRFMLRRATNRQLEEALDGLERALGPGNDDGGADG